MSDSHALLGPPVWVWAPAAGRVRTLPECRPPAVQQREYIRDVDVESFSRLDSDGSVRKGKWVGSLAGLIRRSAQMGVVVLQQVPNSLDPPYFTRGSQQRQPKSYGSSGRTSWSDTQAAVVGPRACGFGTFSLQIRQCNPGPGRDSNWCESAEGSPVLSVACR